MRRIINVTFGKPQTATGTVPGAPHEALAVGLAASLAGIHALPGAVVAR